ncbi:hypothetical protein F2Q68_00002241 [Brassica cretica]|uniref:Uncharacterized protein n=1 Tax=Brassica cretica TaxID=69181 RepID=A0A8S9J8R6_BRACR|nr:hypothetical protein F2Q68_00002241 [Brassica cretica]
MFLERVAYIVRIFSLPSTADHPDLSPFSLHADLYPKLFITTSTASISPSSSTLAREEEEPRSVFASKASAVL